MKTKRITRRELRLLEVVGKRIKTIRRWRKLSEQDFAKLIKLEISDVKDIEAGKWDLKVSMIEAITIALNVHESELFDKIKA